MLSSLNDIKVGLTIIYNGEPHLVLKANFVRMQQRKPVMQTKMRNLLTGKVIEYSFKSGDKVEEADITRKKGSYLYQAGNDYLFMDNSDYEQISLSKEDLGDKNCYLKEGMEVDLMFFDGKLVSVQLPVKIELKVTEAPPGVKGDTAGTATKQITLETGCVVNAPLFIKENDIVKINTETGTYVERVS